MPRQNIIAKMLPKIGHFSVCRVKKPLNMAHSQSGIPFAAIYSKQVSNEKEDPHSE